MYMTYPEARNLVTGSFRIAVVMAGTVMPQVLILLPVQSSVSSEHRFVAPTGRLKRPLAPSGLG
ncbi:hypothetical protein NOVOSPHI9U_470002 [Novosphingobium sp. 9U]|nr:hypothetical protein NOVOSPHI9U_470002 [Novosphingobium sp. 9U]